MSTRAMASALRFGIWGSRAEHGDCGRCRQVPIGEGDAPGERRRQGRFVRREKMSVPRHGVDCRTRTFPTKCKDCGDEVFYFSCTCGSKVFFEELGMAVARALLPVHQVGSAMGAWQASGEIARRRSRGVPVGRCERHEAAGGRRSVGHRPRRRGGGEAGTRCPAAEILLRQCRREPTGRRRSLGWSGS